MSSCDLEREKLYKGRVHGGSCFFLSVVSKIG